MHTVSFPVYLILEYENKSNDSKQITGCVDGEWGAVQPGVGERMTEAEGNFWS